jgi:hypothetical protein
MVGDMRDTGVGTAHAPVQPGHRAEDRRWVERIGRCALLQFVRQHVEQHLGVRIRVDVPAIDPEHLALELLGIDQIAVMTQRDPERRVDVERLRLLHARCRACSGIADVGDADVAGQIAHVSRAEDLAHHAVALPHRKTGALAGGDASGILPAMLQQLQRVVEQLVHWPGRHYADDAAHELLLNAPSAWAGGQPGEGIGQPRRRECYPGLHPRQQC